jgi:site-specific DNA-methyltransferase (adenine-specific)
MSVSELARPNGSARSVHFSSDTNEWATPQALYETYHARWNFTLDPCCTHENAKCKKHYTKAENGLAQDWASDRVWMNPPYGREIGAWMKKAYEEHQKGAVVVCLVPARTDTAWWHDYAAKGQVTFLRGRVRFVGGQHKPGTHTPCAPFPSAIIVYAPNEAR